VRHRAVESLGTVAVPGEWFIVLALPCSHTVAACPHVLQALTTLPACTSCRLMMTLTSGALELWARVSAGAHLRREARSRAIEHVAALELTSAGRRGPEP
jgi:hypothetical protein